jgi:hypothetical protein
LGTLLEVLVIQPSTGQKKRFHPLFVHAVERLVAAQATGKRHGAVR